MMCLSFMSQAHLLIVLYMTQTTGMDPITRRHVWDIIEDAKKGRSIVLTTHSMEEADILSDRIAIMAKGKLHCIGTSIRLKSRFGTGYITNVSFVGNPQGQTPNTHSNAATSEPHLEPVKQFFKEVGQLNSKLRYLKLFFATNFALT